MGKTNKELQAKWREHLEGCEACRMRRDCDVGDRLQARLTHRLVDHYVREYFNDALGG